MSGRSGTQSTALSTNLLDAVEEAERLYRGHKLLLVGLTPGGSCFPCGHGLLQFDAGKGEGHESQ